MEHHHSTFFKVLQYTLEGLKLGTLNWVTRLDPHTRKDFFYYYIIRPCQHLFHTFRFILIFDDNKKIYWYNKTPKEYRGISNKVQTRNHKIMDSSCVCTWFPVWMTVMLRKKCATPDCWGLTVLEVLNTTDGAGWSYPVTEVGGWIDQSTEQNNIFNVKMSVFV